MMLIRNHRKLGVALFGALSQVIGLLMDIVLHLGAHRTATTLFQAYIHSNHNMLAKNGVAAWTPHVTRAGLFDGLFKAPTPLSSTPARALGRTEVAMHLLTQKKMQDLLISEENMIGTMRNNLRAGRLYPNLKERLSLFADRFGQNVKRIGFGLRAYDDYWASALSFAVANGHRLPTDDALDKLVTQPRRWRHVISDIALVFPQAAITVWRYEDFAGAPNRQLQMLCPDLAGLPFVAPKATHRNASPTCDTLRDVLRARRMNIVAIPQGDTRWQPFDPDQATALHAQYAEDIAWLAEGANGIARFETPTQSCAVFHHKYSQRQMDVTGARSHAQDVDRPLTGGHDERYFQRTHTLV